MSVYVHGKDEWQKRLSELLTLSESPSPHGLSVWVPYRLRSLDAKIWGSVSDEDRRRFIGWVLEAAWVAEGAAYCQTYGEWPDVPEGLDVDRFTAKSIDKVDLAEWLANVSYNCCSNGGTVFLPREVDDALGAWRLELLRAVVRVEREGVHP